MNAVSVLHIEHSGVSHARNVALLASKGKYVCYVDSDDFLVSDNKLLLDEYLSKDSFDILCFSQRSHQKALEIGEKNMISLDLRKRDIVLFDPSVLHGKIISRKLIDNNSLLFNENIGLGEDSDFIIKLITNNRISIKYIDSFRYIYTNRNSKSITSTFSWDINESLLVLDRSYKLLKTICPNFFLYNSRFQVGLDYYMAIIYLDNLFKNGNPYSFKNRYKLVSNLKEKLRGDAVVGFHDLCIVNKIYYIVFKLKSTFLIYILFNLKNILRRFVKLKENKWKKDILD